MYCLVFQVVNQSTHQSWTMGIKVAGFSYPAFFVQIETHLFLWLCSLALVEA
jgi:hypothetical protein